MDIRDPFGIRRDFDGVLERLETVIGDPFAYGPVENLADLAITHQFMQIVWPTLTHAEQQRYHSRILYLKRMGRGQTT